MGHEVPGLGSVAKFDLGGEALRERLGPGEEGMVAGLELDQSDVLLDASALHLGGRREVLGADEVGRGLLLPGDLAGWLRERAQRLTG
jgi:hypothetical protein